MLPKKNTFAKIALVVLFTLPSIFGNANPATASALTCTYLATVAEFSMSLRQQGIKIKDARNLLNLAIRAKFPSLSGAQLNILKTVNETTLNQAYKMPKLSSQTDKNNVIAAYKASVLTNCLEKLDK